jgi:N-acetylated-alpha-linked acidic dipeptidase
MRTSLAATALLLVTLAPAVRGQSLPGYTAAASAGELALEKKLALYGDSAGARESRRVLSAHPHVAGTPAQQATAAFVLARMKGFGLDTSRADFQAFIPYPDSSIVERRTPTIRRFKLDEPAIASDPTTAQKPWPAMNGHSGVGDVVAPVIYVNYGLAADYAVLDSLGISVKGKIALVRYGRSYRGIKAREAEVRGVRALLLYSDPQDDGYVRGDVYPDGPMRNPDGVQRGSVYNGDGDPSTPTWPSLPDARRLPEDSMDIPRIPVIPLGYRNAAELLEPMKGLSVPQQWQGGLAFRYHIGAGEVTARVALYRERAPRGYKRITDTFGTIKGSDFPDELVIVGGHRDAWGPGARDNVGGTSAVIEAARAWGRAVSEGNRPRRTLVFATWDAEEWGLIGSAEWAESMEQQLSGRVVAYLNLDDAADGRRFGSGGAASLHRLVRDIAHLVRQPGDSVSVYAAWRKAQAVADSAEPEQGDLGGGSDYASFYNHLGIPSFDFGFGGGGGTYHSAYDTEAFQEKFGDPGALSILAAGRLSAIALARLANADLLPYDEFWQGRYLRSGTASLSALATTRHLELDLTPLDRALDRFTEQGASLDSLLATVPAALSPAQLASANTSLRLIGPAFTRPEGLVGRPWQRNLIIASDRDDGYADVSYPAINEAIKDGDSGRAAREVVDLAQRVDSATVLLRKAVEAARGR